jgi:sulfatase modifying factor 1
LNGAGSTQQNCGAITALRTERKHKRGSSHLCGANYCSRYRPAARQPQEVNLSVAHPGFRTVLSKPVTPSR